VHFHGTIRYYFSINDLLIRKIYWIHFPIKTSWNSEGKLKFGGKDAIKGSTRVRDVIHWKNFVSKLKRIKYLIQ
jgi:hypothetical protein